MTSRRTRPVVVGIVQARLASQRLARKALADLGGRPLLGFLLDSLSGARELDHVVLAIPYGDRELAEIAQDRGVAVMEGSEHDVLGRVTQAAQASNADIVVRMTGDNPLLDPDLVDAAVQQFAKYGRDYLYVEGYPLGCGEAEVISRGALERADREARAPRHREHVITYFVDHVEEFDVLILPVPDHCRRPAYRLTIDQEDDLAVVRGVLHVLGDPDPPIPFASVIEVLDQHPELAQLNRAVRQRP
jgi:spore coat polysaccharide biosynthesis protein SpsF